MKSNCIYKYVCGGDSCTRCTGNATISEIKRKLKNAKTEKEKQTCKQLIERFEKGARK